MANEKNAKLRPTSVWALLALFLVAGITTFFVTDIWLRSGRAPFLIPFILFVVPLVIAGVTAWQAWLVRAYRMGKRHLDPLHAARVWILTQAVSRAGALFAGVSAGMAVGYAATSTSALMSEQIVNLALAGGAALIMAGAGWLAERWCMNDDDEEPGAQSQGARA